MNCVDAAVPGPWWNTLTYLIDDNFLSAPLYDGARVKVPLGKGARIGFVSGGVYPAPELVKNAKIKRLKPVEEVLDNGPALGYELWNLAGWIGNTFLCGTGEALQLICPARLLNGDSIETLPVSGAANQQGSTLCFQEIPFYNPIDEERFAYYRDAMSGGARRTLALFSEAAAARAFYAALPKELKDNSLLWPSGGGKKLWDAWKKTAAGDALTVIGSGGAAFAPINFDLAIVDDEASPAYIFQRAPKISARSIAGRRALTLKARLILGGRMPSARTYMRSRPECAAAPKRGNLVFADLRRFGKTVRGAEGELPITPSLVERTASVLEQGRCAFWIMDRKGQTGEVYCSDCGASLCCPRCKGAMRSEAVRSSGAMGLRCVRCGAREPLPQRCPSCRGSLLLGKRPGLEALLPLAAVYMKGREVLLDEAERSGKSSFIKPYGAALILGTRRLLSLCDSIDAGLIAWLDADAEARKADYNAGFQAFSMVWESCWRGLGKDGERIVLVQSRGSGNSWRTALKLGWGHFWKRELHEREQLALPPYGLMVQIELPKNEDRKILIESIEKEGIMVMDSGEENSPLWVAAKSTEKLREILAPRFEISRSRAGFPVVTVLAE